MLKVTIEDEQEERAVKSQAVIISTLNKPNNIPVFKTLIEGEYSLEDLIDLLASMSVEVHKTFEERTGDKFDYDEFMNNISIVAKKSMVAKEIE